MLHIARAFNSRSELSTFALSTFCRIAFMPTHHTDRPDDAINRRRLLRLGMSGMGLTLPWFLHGKAAQAAAQVTGQAEPRAKAKACIVIYYYGGPSHLDMWDMKPHAPV